MVFGSVSSRVSGESEAKALTNKTRSKGRRRNLKEHLLYRDRPGIRLREDLANRKSAARRNYAWSMRCSAGRSARPDGGDFDSLISMPTEKSPSPDDRLKQEFNRWANDGEGPKMERHHLDITEKTMRRMDLRPENASSISVAVRVGRHACWRDVVAEGPQGFGQVVGVDISDEMIRQARAASKEFDNIMFVRDRPRRFHGKRIFSTRFCRSNLFTTIRIRNARLQNYFASWRLTGDSSS